MPAGNVKTFKPSKYVPVAAATVFLVGSTTLFFIFTCPWLSVEVSLALPAYNAVMFLFVLANFSMATFMDPGIFPRAEEDEDKEDDFRAPLYKTVEVRGVQVRMKWCSTCRFYRPPRCSHCSVCDNCVEVTGKFRGGVNPFSDGCCRNVSHVLCSSTPPRYLKNSQPLFPISPPFLHPVLSENHIGLKILENGVQSPSQQYQSQSSLELTESQSADADPPPPPKPVLSHFTGLRGHMNPTEKEVENAFSTTESAPTPTLYRYRPGYSGGSVPQPGSKLSRVESLQDSSIPTSEQSRPSSSRSEPSLDPELQPLPARSSSLRSAVGIPGPLPSLPSEGTTSTSYKSFNQTQNGSLSYQSLLSPSDETDPETTGYSSPYLSARERPRPACPPPIAPRYGKPRISNYRPGDADAATLPLLTLRDESPVKSTHSCTNGQTAVSPPVSPSRQSGVKTVSGVGGTTYEISV
ncbi:palmitoyltransferase ZDHHC5 isoform X3 [Xenopus laevis]|uniref:protein S-acyltransferase n=1 Tax=Xenopus laevis TaxID=8355 RepID=A0A8J1L7N0_XENLA|nr:palmitoyltransferase ZDHHC5 isoform X3 [Xenopus laevis]